MYLRPESYFVRVIFEQGQRMRQSEKPRKTNSQSTNFRFNSPNLQGL